MLSTALGNFQKFCFTNTPENHKPTVRSDPHQVLYLMLFVSIYDLTQQFIIVQLMFTNLRQQLANQSTAGRVEVKQVQPDCLWM